MPVHSASRLPLGRESWKVKAALDPFYEHFTLHQHDSYEFYFHIRNGGFYCVDGHLIALHPYQLLVIPPHTEHGLIGDAPREYYERLCVNVHPSILRKLSFGSVSLKDIVDEYCTGSAPDVFVPTEEYAELKKIVDLIPPADKAITALDRVEVFGCLAVLLSRFCRYITQTSPAVHAPTQSLIEDVHQYLLEHFTQDCSLERLEELFSISKYHLARRFREHYGVPLHQFVLQARILHAQQLIRQGEAMMNIYDRCGFNDYSAFVRAFDRITGMSPRAWRKLQSEAAACSDGLS